MNALAYIIKHEGFRHRVYDDATGRLIGPGTLVKGNPTIGYGRNVGPHGPGWRVSEAREGLRRDASDAHDFLSEFLTADNLMGFPDDMQPRATALLDMVYNLGEVRFRRFRGLIAAIKESDWDRAADEILYVAPPATKPTPYAARLPKRARLNAEMVRSNREPGTGQGA